MTDLIPVGGSLGGSGSGSNHTPVESDNTLQSKAYAVVFDMLSEGPILGLVDGAKSILFNDIPTIDENNNVAFPGTTASLMIGAPTQDPMGGFATPEMSDPAYTSNVGVVVKNGQPITQTIGAGDTSLSAALVTIELQALLKTADNGDVGPYSVSLLIETRTVPNSWATAVVDTISGKTNSNYERDYLITRPAGNGDWQIRVSRTTADDPTTNSKTSSVFTWARYVALYDNKMEYPNTAYVANYFDASLFGSSVPSRKYLIYGKLLTIPSNYDPNTRSYTGVWDGTFKAGWSDNPAWVFYDLITNRRYGAGQVIDPSTVDKWALYSIGEYCDELVPAQDGSMEPRFTFNGVLDTQQDGLKALQSIASIFDSIVFAGSSTVTLVQDRPNDPLKIFTAANVIGGNFSYEGTSLSSRPTVVRALFADRDDNWNPSVESYEDLDRIAIWGRVSQDIQLVGCTSRGQAYRKAANTVDMAWTSQEIVTFQVGIGDADILPGDMIAIADPAYQDVRLGGRLGGGSTVNSIVLDAPVTINPKNSDGSAASYQLLVTYPTSVAGTPNNPTGNRAVTANIALQGQTTQQQIIGVYPDLPYPPPAGTPWLITSTNLAARNFRVLTVTEINAMTFEVKAVFYDMTRRDRVELGINNKHPNFTLYNNYTDPVTPPTNVSARDYMTGVGTTTVIRVTVSWTPPPTDGRIASYDVRAVKADGTTTYYNSTSSSIDIDGLAVDTYTFGVRTVLTSGQFSVWVDATAPTKVDGSEDPPSAPTNLASVGGARRVFITWSQIVGVRNILHYEIWHGTSPDFGSANKLANVGGTSFTHADDYALPPLTKHYYWVRGVTTTQVFGAYAGPTVATTSYLLVDDLPTAIKNTAAYAQTLLGGAPTLIDDKSAVGTYANQIAFSKADQQLIRWVIDPKTGQGSWLNYIPLLPNPDGSVPGSAIQGALADVTLQGPQIHGALTNATMQAGQIYDVDPQTGQVIRGINVSQLVGNIQATTVADGSITTPKLAANAVTALNITAGAVTANKLAIASAGNVIGNPTCQASAWGWRITGSTVSGVQLGSVTGDGLAPVSYALAGEGSGVMCLSNGNIGTNDFFQCSWDPDVTNGVSCNPGEWWEAQAYLGAHRCYGYLQIEFFDGSGTFISGTSSNRVAGPAAGRSLANYGFTWVKAVAPANTTTVRMTIKAQNDNGSDIGSGTPGQNPFLFFTHTVLGISTPLPINQGAQPQPYSIGGVTQVVGGQIKTGEITARQISSGAILTSKLAVSGAGNLVGNPCCPVSDWGWNAAAAGPNQGTFRHGSVTGDGLAASAYALSGEGSGVLTVSGSFAPGTSEYMQAYWDPDGRLGIACTPGDWWEGQAYLGAHRCYGVVQLQFFNSQTGQGVLGVVGKRVAGPLGGSSLSSYGFSWVKAQVPAGADRVLLCLQGFNDNGGDIAGGTPGQNPYLFFTHALLALSNPTPISQGAQPQPYTIGGVTSVDGGSIKTGAISSRSLATGSVLTQHLSVSAVSNVIPNGCFTVSAAGWIPGANTTVAAWPSNSQWALSGYGSGYITTGSLARNSYIETIWAPQGAGYMPDGVNASAFSAAITCNQGETWEAQGLLQGHRCSASLLLLFFARRTSNGNVGRWDLISSVSSGGVVYGNIADGRSTAAYRLHYARGTAPSPAQCDALTGSPAGTYGYGAELATMTVRGSYDDAAASVYPSNGGQNPYVMMSKLALGVVTAGPLGTLSGAVGVTGTPVGVPMSWSPGGITQIDGGQIRTASIIAGSLAAGSVTAGTLAVNAVVAGTVQAGAIGATEIATGAIKADKLASDFALINSAQIGYLTVDNFNIKGQAVDVNKIGYGAVSYCAYGVSNSGTGGNTATVAINLSAYQGSVGVCLMWRTFFHPASADPTTGFSGSESGG